MLVFIDFDGTITNDSKVNENTIDAIKSCERANNKVILTTGMPRYLAKRIQKSMGLDGYIVSSNGSDIYDSKNNKVIYENFIEQEDILKIYNYCYKNNLKLLMLSQEKEYSNYEVDDNEVELMPNDLELALEKLYDLKIKQVVLKGSNKYEMQKAKKYILDLQSTQIMNDGINKPKCWASFGNKDVSKGNAIKYLVKYLNDDIKNTIAIGNDYNDLSMFDVASYCVAVSDAKEELKQKADMIIPSAKNNGIAKFFKEVKYEDIKSKV